MEGTLGGGEGDVEASGVAGVRDPSELGTLAESGLADATGGAAATLEELAAGVLTASTGNGALAPGTGERGGGAAQPVNPGDAGGAPPTINTVAKMAHG